MVFPSRTDTFGLVNLEAMACGVPVVVDFMAEVGLSRRLDPVRAVAEVDRVQVRRDDLFLRPLVGGAGRRGPPP